MCGHSCCGRGYSELPGSQVKKGKCDTIPNSHYQDVNVLSVPQGRQLLTCVS